MTESDLHPNANPDYLVSLLFRTTATLVLALILLGIEASYPSLISPKASDSPLSGVSEADGRFGAPDPLIGVDRHVEGDRTFASFRNQLHTGFAAHTPWNPSAEDSSSRTTSAQIAAARVPSVVPPGR